LTGSKRGKEEHFVTILSVAVVLGMLVSVAVIFLWRNYPSKIGNGIGLQMAIAFCPAFMLVRVVGGTDDSMLALLITGGTIVLANATLYGGFAALAYWGLTVMGFPDDKRN